jgi:hypothetical protein
VELANGGSKRAGGGGGGLGAIVRNAEGLVVDGREAWLTLTVHRTAVEMHAAGALEVASLASRAWAAFEASTVLADGRWTPREACRKAEALVRRVKAGKLDLGGLKPAEPSYADRSKPVEQARLAVEQAIRRFLAAADSYRAAQAEPAASALGLDLSADNPALPVHAVRTATSSGKTSISSRMTAEHVKPDPDRTFLLGVDRLRLGDDVVGDFARHGVTTRVFRGRSGPDPDRPGKSMCDDLAAVKVALSLGEPVEPSCCREKHPETKATVECPFYSSCGYQRQKASKPQGWIVAHEMLFTAQRAIGKVDAVLVDEAFWQDGVWKSSRGLTLDEIAAPLPLATGLFRERKDKDTDEVEGYRQRLSRALGRQTELGGVRRRHLADEGLTAETCSAAIKAEWRLRGETKIWPGMPAEARKAAAATARGAKHVKAFHRVWAAARTLLGEENPDATSGRLWLSTTKSDEGVVRTVRTRGVKPIAAPWNVPTLLMDATLPDPVILRAFYPQVEVIDDIDVTMPHVTVRQVLGAPVAMRRLFNVDEAEGKPKQRNLPKPLNLKKLRRYILRRWIEMGRKPTLVICQQAVEAWLKAYGLPESIALEHFNNVAGLDQYRDVRLLISIGRTQPQPTDLEADAGALIGLEAVQAGTKPNGTRWFDKVERGIRREPALRIECLSEPLGSSRRPQWQISPGHPRLAERIRMRFLASADDAGRAFSVSVVAGRVSSPRLLYG